MQVDKALEAMNHTPEPRNNLGALLGIQVDQANGIIIGACDSSRPEGAAVGY